MKKRLLTIAQYVFFLGLGFFFVWLSLKDIDHEKRSQIKNALQHARYWLIIPVFAILFITIIISMLIKKKNINDLVIIYQRNNKSDWQGISDVQHLKSRLLFIFYSIALWSFYFISGYVRFYAFQETQQYGIKEGFA